MSRRDRADYEPRTGLRQALPRLVVGICLATAGVLFTLDNLGILDASQAVRWWPALLVLFGSAHVIGARRPSDMTMGAFWALVGVALLLDRLHLLPVRVWDLWPLALVFIGGSIVARSFWPRLGTGVAPGVGNDDDGSTISALAVMSGVQRRSSSIAFRGGNLTAIMGGIEVDLTAARMVADRAVIDCFACWGGIEITVPPGWVVRGRVMPLMGGFGAKVNAPAPGEVTGELLVTGWAIMGGIVIKQQ